MYKVIPGTIGLNGKQDIHNFQITGVWGIKFAKGWDKVHLSIGGEVELSNNFVRKGFAAMPAVGLKWTFK